MCNSTLYLFDQINRLDNDILTKCVPFLSEQRRVKMLSYCFPLDRKLSAAAYLLLRMGLGEKYGINKPVVFEFGETGKPFLRDYPNIHFSLSHCKAAVACVVSESDTGVDVQEFSAVDDNVAAQVLTAKEFAEFKAAKDPLRHFCELWTVKESYAKKAGVGLGMDLSALPAEDAGRRTLICGENYCCCVTGESVSIRRVTLEHLFPNAVY